MTSFFSKKLLLCLVFLPAISVFAGGIDLIKPMVGNYPIRSINGDVDVTGTLEIVATPSGNVGYRLSQIVSSEPVALALLEVLSPAPLTTFTQEANTLVQEYATSEGSLRVEYQWKEDLVSVHATRCQPNQSCKIALINTEISPGETIPSKTFFQRISGSYKVLSAGGHAPHDGEKIAKVETDISTDEANLTFPFCPEAGGLCQPGYLDFLYDSTQVTFRRLKSGAKQYQILIGKERYLWEEKLEEIHFQNYQYLTPNGELTVLTHVLSQP